MKARSPATVNAVAYPVKKTDRTVSAFFEGVRSLNEIALQVRKIPARAFRSCSPSEATSYLKELTKLEKTIFQLRMRIAEDQDEARGDSAVARAKSLPLAVQDADSVGAKLARMVRQGKLLASAEFIVQLGWSRQALSKALGSNRVFYVDFKGERYFPAFYADSAYQRSQLEAATKMLGELPGGAKLQFFLNRRGSLGGATPLEALAKGKLQKVKDVAAAFADVR